MSFSVLVIPEDPLQNGHILTPLVRALMRDVGRPSAKVKVLTQPRVRGYDQAVKVIRDELYANYGFMDLWLFFPDADRANRDAMRALETHVAAEGVTLMCCAAHPEVEIYACAAYRDHIREAWDQIRQHPRMKEEVFPTAPAVHAPPIHSSRNGRSLRRPGALPRPRLDGRAARRAPDRSRGAPVRGDTPTEVAVRPSAATPRRTARYPLDGLRAYMGRARCR